MHGESSSSVWSTSFHGSGTLSHVYIQYLPIRCGIRGSNNFLYDDGNKLLLTPTSDQILSWKVSPFDPNAVAIRDSVSNGPVLFLRYSLDNKVLAVQRSAHEIHFQSREIAGENFGYKCGPGSESILGFFWTDCPTCDVIIVKTSGLDFLICNPESKNLRMVESKRMSVSWYVYTHESRLILLASGLQCKSFVGFQISSAGIVCLPKFEMLVATVHTNNMPVLSAEDLHIITVYGRIYCLQVDRVAMLLHLYRFYRDAVIQQGSLPIYSSKIAVSVVDNVLLVHQVDSKVVILYDIHGDCRAPISAPLPLLLKHYSGAHSFKVDRKDNGESSTMGTGENESIVYEDKWTFLVPDLICDTANGLLWKLQLDLEAISTSSSEVPLLMDFLQRRKLEASKAKKLCLSISRTIILEQRPVSIVARAMDVLVVSYSNAIKSGNYFKGLKPDRSPTSGIPHNSSPRTTRGESSTRDTSFRPEPSNGVSVDPPSHSSVSLGSDSKGEQVMYDSNHQVTGSGSAPLDANLSGGHERQLFSAAISPSEIYQFVFAPVNEEMSFDPTYLVSIVAEFLRSANSEKIRIPKSIYVLLIQLLARSKKFAELELCVINKVIEPSREVALQLLDSGRQNLQTRNLGMDMLRQLSLYNEYIMSLVDAGYYLEALRYARKHKVSSIRPSVFLEAAYSSKDSQHLASVLRFLSDFLPEFKNTSDHVTYCHILSEMNSSVAA